MRAPKHSITATGGATEVQSLLLRLGWGVSPVPQEHDLGTDLLAAVRDDRLFDTGLLVGVQVKAGPSFFEQPHSDEAGNIDGWWYYEDTPDHFDYWVKHQAPHLLVLYDFDAKKAYWVHVTPDRCVSTGKGVRILVPANQSLEPSHAGALLAVAVTKRASISLEGTAFDAAAYPIALGDRLRHAMLMPRLVAPHQNRGFVAEISPEEAIAMLSLFRIHQFRTLMEGHAAWPDLRAAPVSRDWRWAFVHAVWRLLTTKEPITLVAATKSSTRPDWTACAICTLAAAYYDRADVDTARTVVQHTIAQDHAAPVDLAWLLLHDARYALELGDSTGAATAVDRAIAALTTSVDDASATFLRGLAYRSKLLLSDLTSASSDLSKTIAASDNAGAWWRAQQTLWASESVHEELFRDWSGNDQLRLDNNPAINQLHGVVFGAGLAADQSAWQSAQLRLGRFLIMRASTATEAARAMHTLARSGNAEAFCLAAKRLVQQGPCSALAMIAPALAPDSVLRSQTTVFLKYWALFGHYADAVSADTFAQLALTALMAPNSATAQMLPWYEAHNRAQLLDALCGALPVVTTQIAARIGDAIPSIPDLRAIEVDPLARLVANLVQEHPAAMTPDAIIDLADRHPDALALSGCVATLAEQGNPSAKAMLKDRIAAGDNAVRQIALELDLLALSDIEALGASLRAEVERFRMQHPKSISGGNRGAVSRMLALVALKANDPADWQALAGYLGDAEMVASDKRATAAWLARNRQLIPEHARMLLAGALPGLAASRHTPRGSPLTSERDPATDLAALLGAALGVPDDSRDDQLTTMLLDPSATVRQRALLALSFRSDEFVADVAVRAMADTDASVRATAAGLVARLVREGRVSDALRFAAKVAANDSGELAPLTFVDALRAEVSQLLGDEIEVLKNHPSARVRSKATAVVVKQEANDVSEAGAVSL